MNPSYVVGITGASGSAYALRLVQVLLQQPVRLHLIVSRAGAGVLAHEAGLAAVSPQAVLAACGGHRHAEATLTLLDPDDLFAAPASGSFRHHGMAIVPCSMRSLAAVAGGLAGELIHRAADVCLKERRPLVLVPRETPLSRIHLENMLRVVDAGAILLPACPAFYRRPQGVAELVDSVVARVLDHLGVEHRLVSRWGEPDGDR
jgi:4-hydroxy-3-polyprenylbenzoate decarboxylase